MVLWITGVRSHIQSHILLSAEGRCSSRTYIKPSASSKKKQTRIMGYTYHILMPEPLPLPLLPPPSPNMVKKRKPIQHRQKKQTIEQATLILVYMTANCESHGRLLWSSSQIICPFLFSCHDFPCRIGIVYFSLLLWCRLVFVIFASEPFHDATNSWRIDLDLFTRCTQNPKKEELVLWRLGREWRKKN